MSDAADGGRGLGRGVTFARRDYAGLVRRLSIILIDSLLIVMAWVALRVPIAVLKPDVSDEDPIWKLACWGFAYSYLTLLRGPRFPTLGCLMAGARVVNLKGDCPSFFWMNVRLFSWVSTPGILLCDLLWFWGDRERRTLRDRLVGAYVIRKGATPSGDGPIRPITLFVLGGTFTYPEVIGPPTDR